MKLFREALAELIRDKRSNLCVSFDAALPCYRSRYTISEHYLRRHRSTELDDLIVNFCMDVIDRVTDYVVLAKFNLWYLAQLERKTSVRQLILYAKKRNMLTILDCKINDIQDTLEIGLKAIAELGIDCITVNPLPGNLSYIVNSLENISKWCGRNMRIGTLVLTFMSNREATKYFLEAQQGEKKLYQVIAEEVRESNSDGCVVGLTYTSPGIIRNIRDIIGPERVLFLVGVGAQGGSIDLVKHALPGLVVVNVGRSLIYSEDPQKVARELNMRLQKLLENNLIYGK